MMLLGSEVKNVMACLAILEVRDDVWAACMRDEVYSLQHLT